MLKNLVSRVQKSPQQQDNPAVADPVSVPKEPQKPIYLISMAGVPNYGDELITARWLKYLARTQPENEVWLDVREPGTAASLFKGIHPKLHITNTIFRAIHEFETGKNRAPAELVTHLGSPKFDAGLLELREAGTIHLLGGGFINSMWQSHALIIEVMRAAREVSGARLIATGLGLMPFFEVDFSDFEHLSVRDTPSAQALGIERGYDDAFLVDSATFTAADGDSQTAELFVCLQNDVVAEGEFEKLVDFTRQQITALGIPRERVRYVEAIPGDDYAGYAAMQDLIAKDGFIPFTEFWRSNFSFNANQVWLTSRFHHHLNAALHGARGIVLMGLPGYYDVKHGSLFDLGTHWKVGGEQVFTLDQLGMSADLSSVVRSKNAEADSIYGDQS